MSEIDQASDAKPDIRACSCHPDERPEPCKRKYAFRDCWRAAVLEETQQSIVVLKNRQRGTTGDEDG